MGAQNHVHDWAATRGGWVCTILGCTATLSDLEAGANLPTGPGHTSAQGGLNIAYKKIHG